MLVLEANVRAEDWADKVWENASNEYDQAKEAIQRKLKMDLGRITVTELLQSILRDNPEIPSRHIRSALADLRGSLFYLESDGRIVAPRQARPTKA